jgi:hypothetical protein
MHERPGCCDGSGAIVIGFAFIPAVAGLRRRLFGGTAPRKAVLFT